MPVAMVVSMLSLVVPGQMGTQASTAPQAVPQAVQGALHPTKVLVVMEENHSYSEMKASMPYLWSLATKYGYASNYHAVTHPSLPNYLAISGGSTFGVTDDATPSAHPINSGDVFDQAIAAGKTAHVYAESMPSNCDLSNSLPYVVRHTGWPYYVATGDRTNCGKFDTNSTGFDTAAKNNSLANVTWLIPNLCNDAHGWTGCSSSSLGTADNWLKAHLPNALNSTDFSSGNLAIVITADEDDTTQGNQVLAVVCDANLSGKVVTTSLNHYGLSRWLSETVGATPLNNAATATDMRTAFGL